MKIAIGCDPNAQQAKEELIKFMEDKGYGEIKDFGSEDPIYANTAVAVAEAVASGEYDRGILIWNRSWCFHRGKQSKRGLCGITFRHLLSKKSASQQRCQHRMYGSFHHRKQIKRRINRCFPDKRIRSGMLFSAKGRCFQRV